MKSTRAIRLLIADDHFFTRDGLKRSLDLEPDIEVVALAADGEEAVSLFEREKPDVALLDGSMPGLHGVEVTERIVQASHDAGVVLFSVDDREEDVFRAVHAGARSYLSKQSSREELVKAIRMVAEGQRFFPAPIQRRLKSRIVQAPISGRELEVLGRVAEGMPNKAIAQDLGVSIETVKTHLGRVLAKLGASDRTQAVVKAMDRGILRRGRDAAKES